MVIVLKDREARDLVQIWSLIDLHLGDPCFVVAVLRLVLHSLSVFLCIYTRPLAYQQHTRSTCFPPRPSWLCARSWPRLLPTSPHPTAASPTSGRTTSPAQRTPSRPRANGTPSPPRPSSITSGRLTPRTSPTSARPAPASSSSSRARTRPPVAGPAVVSRASTPSPRPAARSPAWKLSSVSRALPSPRSRASGLPSGSTATHTVPTAPSGLSTARLTSSRT